MILSRDVSIIKIMSIVSYIILRSEREVMNYNTFLVIFLSTFLVHCARAQDWKPKVSIITSVFKGKYYMGPFLEDITRQTIFDDCELILINAHSPDKEEEIIKRYMQVYPNIVYVRLEKDPGLYAVWNQAIKMSRGKYITNANLDDRLAPDCYEVHAQALDENPGVELVYSDSYWTRCPNETFEMNSSDGIYSCAQFSRKAMKNSLPAQNPMWRKSMHDRYGYFDESYFITGDYKMWIKMVEMGAVFKKVPGIHGLFLSSDGLSTSQNTIDRATEEYLRVKQEHKAFFKSIGEFVLES
jgi:glycosyltransferase involved in cell wall biosynthesis